MGSLGYVMQVPEEEKYLMSKDEILTRITTLFGGRAAEQIVFNSIHNRSVKRYRARLHHLRERW